MPSHQGRTHQGRKVAVCGKPIAHSLSPVIHAAGFAAAGLFGWSYGAIECAESELPQLVAGLGPEWAGLSLTMPLKEVALAVAADAAPVAIAAGAANTLVRRHDGTWYADNTDIAGIVRVLRDAGLHHAGPSSHGPSTAGPSTAGPASAGPASAGPASAGPASAGPASAGPASAGPASAG
ncbi:shikimate dehydrogenase, partial [Actinoplanes sp. NPDC051494]